MRLNNYLTGLQEYIDDQFQAHPRAFLICAIVLAFGLAQLF